MSQLMDRAALLADLTHDEAFRPYIYDDATGKAITSGIVLRGKATLAIGWCPETNPCPKDLAQYILGYFADNTVKTLRLAAPWIDGLSEPRQRALANMAFQLGVTGLLKFNTFMGLMQQGQYDAAASDLETTLWYKQSGARAKRIQTLIGGSSG